MGGVEPKGKALKDLLILRRAQVTLSPYVSELDLKSSSDTKYLEGICYWRRWRYVLRFKCDKLLSTLIKELLRLEPAMIGGKIDVESVKALVVALYAPAKSLVPPLRMQVKKRAGLLKDKRLRNRVIAQKIMARRRLVERV